MGYFGSTLDALFTTFRQALKKPTTVQYPYEQRERAPRIRASFALTHDQNGEENCIGCKKCENICPSEIITVKAIKKSSEVTGKARGYAEDFTLNLQACIICELCVQVCPTDAIIMTQEQESPGFSREDLVLTMDKLYANEKSKRWAWSNATVLGEQQDPDRGIPGKEKKAEDAEGEGEEKKAKPEKAEKPKKEPKAEGDAKAEKPKKEPKAEAKAEKPTEEPKAEVKADRANGDVKVEAAKSELPSPEGPKVEAPNAEPSQAEASKAEQAPRSVEAAPAVATHEVATQSEAPQVRTVPEQASKTVEPTPAGPGVPSS
ncbi:MAG: 4Fe-4S dicluster domain-containing protein [Deltaproteobacteria bacterium]|nr:4Fe-4S dicluster domain-containing protein [Deltaproteobacteria bacterium]